MATFTQMVSRVRSLVANHSQATTTVVGEFINSRHRGLLESFDWSRRKQDIIIGTVIDKTAGTIALTNGSSTVTGTSTSFASTDVGRSLIIGDSIYSVFSYTSATSIKLGDANGTEVTYPGETESGLSYVMFTQRYSLGTGIEQIISVKQQSEITEVSEEYLDSIDPTRQATGDCPSVYARTSRGSSDDVRIELYPRPSAGIAINVKIEKGHTDLSGSNNPIVPSGPVEWFAAVDSCYFLFAKTSDQKWLALAAKYEDKAQESLEFEKNQDYRKFGVIQSVRDVGGGTGLGGTDFGLDHDVGD